MYISDLYIVNFRKYEKLDVKFNKDLNVIVGENNSGKTAIIDAIRLLLGTQGNEYYRIEREDFYCSNGKYANEIKIKGIIRGINVKEGGKFLEYISYQKSKNENEEVEYSPYIQLELIARYENKRIYYDIYVGDFEGEIGIRIPAEIKDYFRTVFLKPLRDAETQMIAKKNSRLSQILMNFDSELLEDKEENELIKIIKDANEKLKSKTNDITVIPIGEKEEKSIIELINNFISSMNAGGETSLTDFKIKDNSLKEILERLSVEFESQKEGLGIENLLYTAIEFLLLKNSNYIGLKTVLIEEIEAHLHPQTQLNLINYLIKNYAEREDGQIIMTTHSPNITSKVDIEKILMCKDNMIFNMGEEYTNLEKGDYKFLKRFLDVTKSNLFFAKALIFIEGDAENMLVPVLAKIIFGDTLESKGISVINVGNTAFLRYSKIFQRKDKKDINVKIAIITDLDIKRNLGEQDTELEQREKEQMKSKEDYYNYNKIKVYVSPKRTLEYCIALSSYKNLLLESIYEAEKEENSLKYPNTEEKKKECKAKAIKFFDDNKLKPEEIADKIYEAEFTDKKISKAIAAQILSNKIENEYNLLITEEEKNIYKSKLESDIYIKYIIDAIKYVGDME